MQVEYNLLFGRSKQLSGLNKPWQKLSSMIASIGQNNEFLFVAKLALRCLLGHRWLEHFCVASVRNTNGLYAHPANCRKCKFAHRNWYMDETKNFGPLSRNKLIWKHSIDGEVEADASSGASHRILDGLRGQITQPRNIAQCDNELRPQITDVSYERGRGAIWVFWASMYRH
jgi:hypothetical protein